MRPDRLAPWLLLVLPAVCLAEVEFNRDIRPILSDRCFTCHGPDANNRKTALRLDSAESTASVLQPGSPAASKLYQRISSDDASTRMPPAYAGHAKLSDSEIAKIGAWIEQGAEWQGHWSFVTPRRPSTPDVSDPAWVHNPIDAFVLARLDREELEPSPPASREKLLRRVSLDLTGLPPTPHELDAFLADPSPRAYEHAVGRLLASPRYGERMAIRWLDAARYADTNGYQTDAPREMWRWRDWVIDAFNENKPFDEFTLEQLAGDMLPGATLDQIVATGFNRNHRANGEGGIIPEEYAVEYVVDRVETTSTVWLGLTLGCARCHDHKYDPFSQKEFYQLYGYFNNLPERGNAFKYGNSPPFIKAPTQSQKEKLDRLDADLEKLRDDHRALLGQLETNRIEWQREMSAPLDWSDPRDRILHFYKASQSGEPATFTLRDGEYLELGDQANFDYEDRFTISAWIKPTQPTGAIVSRTGDRTPEEDTQNNKGWGFYLKDGKLQLNLITRWLDDCLRIETRDPIELHTWTHVAARYAGTKLASGVTIFVNGQPVPVTVIRDEMNQPFRSREPLRVGAGLGYRFDGEIAEVSIYKRAASDSRVAQLAVRQRLDQIAQIPAADRTPAQQHKLQAAYANEHGPAVLTKLTKDLRDAVAGRQAFYDSIPTVMVMSEAAPKPSHVLNRGAYDAAGERVRPALPAALGAPPASDRLAFARWVTSRNNPLTARVTVNRFWQMLFGTGLVATVEDFGSQGEPPSHPALLDWLAVEFMDSGWDTKQLLKTIVLSNTYQQSSALRQGLTERDPDNRLLARGPRFRLPAEAVRDQALAVAGLLVEKPGGPSVKPYQPEGLWKDLSGGRYVRSRGEDLYRRSLYTFWKRSAPPPSMMNFDSAGREACTVRATRTNTPLQALNLMNDVTFVEAARHLAARLLDEGGETPNERLTYGFRLVTARAPKPQELAVLTRGLRFQLARFEADPGAARELLRQGDSPLHDGLDRNTWAAYTTTANLLLNLDEAITKD